MRYFEGLVKSMKMFLDKDFLVKDLAKSGIPGDLLKRYEKSTIKYAKKRSNAIANGGYSMLIKNTDHTSYEDVYLFSPLLKMGNENPRTVFKIVNDFTLTFFNKYLKGDASASLENTAKKYKNVEFAQTPKK
jgi:hypothetical protein